MYETFIIVSAKWRKELTTMTKKETYEQEIKTFEGQLNYVNYLFGKAYENFSKVKDEVKSSYYKGQMDMLSDMIKNLQSDIEHDFNMLDMIERN